MDRRKETVLQSVPHDCEIVGREHQDILHREDDGSRDDTVQLGRSVADPEVEMYGDSDQHQSEHSTSEMENHSEQSDHRRQNGQDYESDQAQDLGNNTLNNIGCRHDKRSFSFVLVICELLQTGKDLFRIDLGSVPERYI